MNNKNNLIFALDIGTRKVVGIVAEKTENKLRILDVEILEHKSRTMLDGQIHNVNEVAKIVKMIKQSLEERLNIRLQKAGVAVAGRALKTIQAKIEKKISLDEEITEDNVRNLELEAVSSILGAASHNFGRGDYLCVGYSVVYYELDGVLIGELAGHFGRSMAVEVIATFLPRVVLDSMLSVLHKADLEIMNLTLEPIAAINAIIPQDVRRLNLLLLDIGAGTSDIALTKDGAVFAYGMVPEAGDEITEMICEKYILDFATAERIKRLLDSQSKVKFKDILGREHELPSEQIKETIFPRVKALAQAIVKCVFELNQKVPHAVVLVGGGSLTPLLDKELALSFPVEQANIGIRLPEMIEGIEDTTGRLKTPDMVTPIGIMLMTADTSGLKFIELFVNERRVQILNMQQNLEIVGALVAAGIDNQRLYGKIGKALCLEVNGKLKVIKGKMGKPALIKLNGKQAELDYRVKNKDKIVFKEAQDGEDAQGKIKDVIEETEILVTVNGQEIKAQAQIVMNNFPAGPETELVDHAYIEYNDFVSAREVLEKAGINTESLEEREIVIRVNKEPRILTQHNFRLLVDGKQAVLNTKVTRGSVVEFESTKPEFYRVRDVIEIPPAGRSINVVLNGKEYAIEGTPGKIFMNGQIVGPDEFLIDRAEIITSPGDNVSPTVSHVLKYLPVNPEEQRGKMLKITVNGQPSGFTTKLTEGVDISISFVDRESV